MNGENGDLLQQLGLYAWEDSAEFRATLFWTDDFLSYFNTSRGYDIVPVLPILFGTTGLAPSTLTDGYFYFSFNEKSNGTNIDWKIRNDFYQALQELYETYHLEGLSSWSAKFGLQGSLQPYATAPNLAPPWDMVSAAAHIDAPETESNYFDGVIDAFRAMGGGAMMGQKQIFSSELGAHRYFAYAETVPLILNDCAINYVGGVNRIVTHGFPYSGYRPEVEWPGLTTFEWTYSGMWGPRQPAWAHVREMADWIARTQLILQSGVPRVDVGIYRHKYISVDIKHVRNSTSKLHYLLPPQFYWGAESRVSETKVQYLYWDPRHICLSRLPLTSNRVVWHGRKHFRRQVVAERGILLRFCEPVFVITSRFIPTRLVTELGCRQRY